MNMVIKYVFLIFFLSVLLVFAYGSSSVFDSNIQTKQLDLRPMNSPLNNEIKIQEKLKTRNEVVYHTHIPISDASSIKDEIPSYDTTKNIETDIMDVYTTTTKNKLETEAEPTSISEVYPTISRSTTDASEEYLTTRDNTGEYSTMSSTTDNSEYQTPRTTNSEEYPTMSSTTTDNSEYPTTPSITTDNSRTTVTPTTSTNNPTEITTINICESAELTAIEITPYPFSLNISWINSVEAEYCNFNYRIQSIQAELHIFTGESFIFINELHACTYYEAIISILYAEKEIYSKKISKTTSEAVDEVQQLQYKQIAPNFEISWLPSIRTKSCIKYYKWQHFQDEKLVQEKNVDSTNVIISQPNGCLNNTFSVSAAISNFLGPPQNVTYMDVKVNDPPIFVSANTSTNKATTIWTFEKICRPQSFLLKLTSDYENFTIQQAIHLDLDNRIVAEANELFAFTNYSFQGAIKNIAGTSEWSEMSPFFQTKEKEPDAPENLHIIQHENNTLHISWKKPQRWNGDRRSYILTIKFCKLNYTLNSGCPEVSHFPINKEFDEIKTDYYYNSAEPASLYTISISAKSSGGIGPSIYKDIITNEGDKPIFLSHNFMKYSIKHIYNVTVYVEWRTPCRVNGIISHYNVQFAKCNSNENEHYIIPITPLQDYNITFKNVSPDTCYNFLVQLYSQSKYSEETLRITTPAGVPDIAETTNIPIPNATTVNPETTANVFIKKNIFNPIMGEIIYYAIIVAQSGCEENPKSDINSLDNWPKVVGNEMCSDESEAYQATKIKWNPFMMDRTINNTDFVFGDEEKCDLDTCIFVLGTAENCDSDICNRPLTPNTNYSIKIRGFTRSGFSDTRLIYFNTAKFVDDFQLGLIVGLVFGILAIAFIIAAALFYTKGKLNFTGWPRMESNSNISPAPLPVPLKKFKIHYAKMIENSGKIKNEFQLLSTISSDVTLSTKTAMLPINRKKNRYINILPYDQTRVKLNDTSITASDFINASYIKGYNEFNEYIATQGPTESTSTAFWQMIIEQNVKLIVMLTQFVESGKDKCYKYFPDLNDSQDYSNVITVECLEEMLLPNFNRRTFKVTKGKHTKTITHLQFNLWPDFGVPHDLHHIIEFCKIIKEIRLKKPFLVVMHCSAGVGRTGTLIAVDILMQTIKDKRKVDIFGTVLNLRKQRMNMVQSEIQYEFLYKCVNYLLSDNSRKPKTNLHQKIHLDQIEEGQISESNMLTTFKH